MNWTQLAISVTSGVLVASILAFARTAWARRQVPTALSRGIARHNYVATVLAMSRGDRVRRLEALVPNVEPAAGTDPLEDIQEAWQRINARNGTRIVTRENRDCLTAGAELLSKGIEVRVAPSLNTDGLSYHIFTGDEPWVVVNNRVGARDHPNRINGLSATRLFHDHFETIWESSTALECVLAEQVLTGFKPNAWWNDLAEQINGIRQKYRLDAAATNAMLCHLAFRHRAPVIFITGLPGAGKSRVRNRLAQKLLRLRFQVEEMTDYLYAFRDFLSAAILLDGCRDNGFSAEPGGAFRVNSEKELEPALQSIANRVYENRSRTSLTLVEFARTDVVGALKVFGDDVLASSQVIYVHASSAIRTSRLEARAQPPQIQVAGSTISIHPSDDHKLPPAAADSLYAVDNSSRLRSLKDISGRLYDLDNDIDDPDFTLLDQQLDSFVENIVRPYRELVKADCIAG